MRAHCARAFTSFAPRLRPGKRSPQKANAAARRTDLQGGCLFVDNSVLSVGNFHFGLSYRSYCTILFHSPVQINASPPASSHKNIFRNGFAMNCPTRDMILPSKLGHRSYSRCHHTGITRPPSHLPTVSSGICCSTTKPSSHFSFGLFCPVMCRWHKCCSMVLVWWHISLHFCPDQQMCLLTMAFPLSWLEWPCQHLKYLV